MAIPESNTKRVFPTESVASIVDSKYPNGNTIVDPPVLKATAISDSEIRIELISGGEHDIWLEESKTGTDPWSIVSYTPTFPYIRPGRADDTPYYYRGKHVNDYAESGYSAVVSDRTFLETALSGGTSAFSWSATALEEDAEITALVDGSQFGFGSKLQAAPCFLDEGDKVYENGVLNLVRENHIQGQVIEIESENPNEVYTARGNSGPAYYEEVNNLRVPGKPHLRLPGASCTLEYPRACAFGSPYPEGNPTIYIAWWTRSKYNAYKYRRYIKAKDGTVLNESSGFIGPADGELFGERITGTDGLSGRIIGITSEGISVQFDVTNTGFADGVTATGETSGMSFVVDTSDGFEKFNGSNKWMRVWGTYGTGSNLHVSWTQMHMTNGPLLDQIDGGYWTTTADEMEQKWALMEYLLTPDRSTARVDGVIKHESIPADPSGLLPWPADEHINAYMIGFNGNSSTVQIHQEVGVSDLYIDHSPKRFYLADAPTILESTKHELQFPLTWDTGKVKMRMRLRTLDPSTDNIWLIYSDDHHTEHAVQVV